MKAKRGCALSFPKDRLRPFGKFSRPLRVSVRGRVFALKAGWGGVRRQLVGMGRCGRCGVWCACALERVVEVWCAQGRVDSAGRRRGCAGDARCTAVMPVRCAGCFAPWWRCSSVAWRPQCPFVIVSGGGLEGHCSAASILSTRRLAQATALGLGDRAGCSIGVSS